MGEEEVVEVHCVMAGVLPVACMCSVIEHVSSSAARGRIRDIVHGWAWRSRPMQL